MYVGSKVRYLVRTKCEKGLESLKAIYSSNAYPRIIDLAHKFIGESFPENQPRSEVTINFLLKRFIKYLENRDNSLLSYNLSLSLEDLVVCNEDFDTLSGLIEGENNLPDKVIRVNSVYIPGRIYIGLVRKVEQTPQKVMPVSHAENPENLRVKHKDLVDWMVQRTRRIRRPGFR